jgi:hypothetical protein
VDPTGLWPAGQGSYRSFAILLKGLLRKDLRGLTEDEFQQELGLQSVDKVKFRLPKDLERRGLLLF